MEEVKIIEEVLNLAETFSSENQKKINSDHTKRVAQILLDLNIDNNTVAAGLLHEASLTYPERVAIEKRLGEEVLNLYDGTKKISQLTTQAKNRQQALSVRKMIFALIDDIRVIVIKLADKVDRMRNLKGVDEEKQRKTAAEAIGIWAPIANRLGMSSLKDELEDLSLKFSNPEVFAQIKQIVAQKKDARADYIDRAIEQITAEAQKRNIKVEVKGRAKHFYSIYQKMRKRNKSADELYDLLAIRILCRSSFDCYTIIGLVHTLWQPIDGRFKDYIAKPKENGYQSLHTTVLCDDKPLEIQIRTFAMHEMAEHGVASHWLYKKGTNQDTVDAQSLNLVNKMKDLGTSLKSGDDSVDYAKFFAAIKEEFLGQSVFVFTPRGDVIELPAGSCAIDFAYAIHSEIGEKITGAKANGIIIPLSAPLQHTQTIEILTSPSAHPTVNQLNIVKTPKAKARILAWLTANDAVFAQTHQQKAHEIIGNAQTAANHAGHVNGHANIAQSANAAGTKTHPAKTGESTLPNTGDSNAQNTLPPAHDSRIAARIRIGDTSNFMFSFAGCCNPQPGDEVVGYVSRGRGIIVHKENCRNLWKIQQIEKRMLQLEWEILDKKKK